MFGIDPHVAVQYYVAASAFRLWIAAGSAVLLVMIVCALAFRRSRKGVLASAVRFVLVVFAAILSGTMTWAFFDSAEHRALDMRAEQLNAQALLPGSPLACLDALAGEALEMACERSVFASPASVANAISYVAARFDLFSDMVAYTRRGGGDIDNALQPLRRTLEADPFGFLAHVLAARDGCRAEKCAALALLRDPNHVRTNLIAQTLDRYVDHYREVWAKASEVPTAELPEGQPTATATAQMTAPGQRKVIVNIDFPTAASIPPISIMNSEPKGESKAASAPGSPNAAPAAASPPSTASPARGSPKRAPKPPPQSNAQSAPPPQAAEAQTDPVWTPAPAAPATR